MRAATVLAVLALALPAAGLPAPGTAEERAFDLLAAAQAAALDGSPEALLELHASRDAGRSVDLEPVLAEPLGLAEELRRLLAAEGVALDAGLEHLEALPAPLERSLALLARAHRDAGVLARAAFAESAPPAPLLLAEAKVLLARAALAALPDLVPGSYVGVDACGAVLLELEGVASVHDCDYVFAVDLGGDDAWRNNAGGNLMASTTCSTNNAIQQDAPPTTAFALDRSGDDAYTGSVFHAGVTGGSCNGLGALIEVEGDDTYNVTVRRGGGNGAANYGAGLLLDMAGNDTYDGRVAPQAGLPTSGGLNGGSNFGGHGDLLDLAGRDAYNGTISQQGGLNGGENDGSGFLADLGAEGDSYDGFVRISGGINGGSSLGRGLLLDAGGDDVYRGRVGDLATFLQNQGTAAQPHGGVNGGAAAFSDGALLDLGGNDDYAGEVWGTGGVNSGAYDGSALLVDVAGDDTYAGFVVDRGGVNGGASRGGTAALHDLAGSDRYVGVLEGTGGVNGGAVGGSGLLSDLGGDDTYDGAVRGLYCDLTLPLCGGWANGGGLAGLGVLLDGGGRDAYRANGGLWALDASEAKGTGAQLDLPGP